MNDCTAESRADKHAASLGGEPVVYAILSDEEWRQKERAYFCDTNVHCPRPAWMRRQEQQQQQQQLEQQQLERRPLSRFAGAGACGTRSPRSVAMSPLSPKKRNARKDGEPGTRGRDLLRTPAPAASKSVGNGASTVVTPSARRGDPTNSLRTPASAGSSTANTTSDTTTTTAAAVTPSGRRKEPTVVAAAVEASRKRRRPEAALGVRASATERSLSPQKRLRCVVGVAAPPGPTATTVRSSLSSGAGAPRVVVPRATRTAPRTTKAAAAVRIPDRGRELVVSPFFRGDRKSVATPRRVLPPVPVFRG